jgi:hypothetical protein
MESVKLCTLSCGYIFVKSVLCSIFGLIGRPTGFHLAHSSIFQELKSGTDIALFAALNKCRQSQSTAKIFQYTGRQIYCFSTSFVNKSRNVLDKLYILMKSTINYVLIIGLDIWCSSIIASRTLTAGPQQKISSKEAELFFFYVR